ncbi:MAG: NAD(P)H-dependent glycerol-3-phosphate dehydrogenase [Collinsella sp.]|nr:NAD(P)H-dependent glycerol-3-phosphate dehydrogenase [Collinsella sp.]
MKIAMIGAGSWGTAVAGLAAARADEVTMWSHGSETAEGINEHHRNPRYLTDYQLPENIEATCDMARALEGAEGVIVAVPSAHLRGVAHQMAEHIDDSTPVLCLTKGVEMDTGFLMSEVVGDEIGHPERIAALSGPNHAEEVCKGCLSAAVIASEEPEVSSFFKELLISPAFRIYVSPDMVGVEMCGATKNIIAVVCGISVGAGYGDNTLAMIMTRGLAEISRLVHARGGDPMTCMGLAGMGDLVATCTSEHSRNRSFGVAFSQGVTLEEYQDRSHMVVEGAAAASSVSRLAESLGVDTPLTFALDRTLHHGGTIAEALETLTDRCPNQEFYGMDD